MTEPLMLTRREVRELLRLSDYQLKKLEARGVLHPIGERRQSYRYPKSEVLKLARATE